MQPANKLRFFISYSRKDGADFARQLRQDLAEKFGEESIWQDIIAMRGNQGWWEQIVHALENVEYMVLVATPGAMQSEVVEDEWMQARELGVCVLPVMFPDHHPDFEAMPRWMSKEHFCDYGQTDQQARLLNDLNTRCEMPRVVFMADPPPEDFVPRPRETQALLDHLLGDNPDDAPGETVAITAALRGTGGYGKTTLARHVCHQREVRRRFDDGLLWVELGEEPGSLVAKVNGLIRYLKPGEPEQTDINMAKARLRELLDKRDVLLVVDDVWQPEHLRPFENLGPTVTVLVTTRYDHVLPPNTKTTNVDAMQPEEAVQMLSAGLDTAPENQPALQQLAERLGRWPQALRVVNGILRNDMQAFKLSSSQAIANFNEELDEIGIAQLDPDQINPVLDSSLKRLSAEDRARFMELAIFPEDIDIPLAVIKRLWSATGDLSAVRVRRTLRHIQGLSLFWEIDSEHARLHDVIRTYLREQNTDQLPDWHSAFLDSYSRDRWADLPADEPYLWAHLAEHLREAGRQDELRQTVLDGRYLARKTLYQQQTAVESDLNAAAEAFLDDEMLKLLQRSYVQMAHILQRCENLGEVATTLYNRLQHLNRLAPVWEALHDDLPRPHIVPKHRLPDLPHPALIRTLTNHMNLVEDVAISPDGSFIVSSSSDNTLKVWDVATGQERRTLSGHGLYSVNGVAISPDGTFIVSASDDRTLKVWDTATGQEIHTLSGHRDFVSGVAISRDGSIIVSASDDETLKVWDAATGQEIHTLTGHTDDVNGVAISPDGTFIVSASDDRTLKVWDTATGQEIHTLTGHTSFVSGMAISPDESFIVSASWDQTLKVWDAAMGQEIRTLSGHTSGVRGVAISPDGSFIVSASGDKTLKVWDAATGQEIRTLSGHTSGVRGVAISCRGDFIISASGSMGDLISTIKVWDATIDVEHPTLAGHTDEVTGIAISPDGSIIVSASDDETLKVWDAATGQEIHTLTGHWESVNAVAISPDGSFIVSAGWDKTLKVWDAVTGEEIRTLTGRHMGSVNGVVISPTGDFIVSVDGPLGGNSTLKVWDTATGQEMRALISHTSDANAVAISPDGSFIVSASKDETVKVWDTATGQEIRTLTGHTHWVNGIAISPDGSTIVSAAWDETLKLWDAATGQERRTLSGHTRSVSGVAISPDGSTIVSASEDETLKLWDIASGTCLHTFYADAPLICCAWSSDGETVVAGNSTGGVYFLRGVL